MAAIKSNFEFKPAQRPRTPAMQGSDTSALREKLRAYGGNNTLDYRHVAAAEIERLEAERDEWRMEAETSSEAFWAWKVHAEAAEALCDKLAEALRPLAAEADARATLALGPDIDDWPIGGSSLTLGNIRRAREALEQVGKR